jgi:hypothetical protein
MSRPALMNVREDDGDPGIEPCVAVGRPLRMVHFIQQIEAFGVAPLDSPLD